MSEKFLSSKERTSDFSPEMMHAMVHKTQEVNGLHSLDMQQFVDVYGIAKVQEDYAKVAERMKNHLDQPMGQSEKLGHIFEAAFLDLASRHKWFGERSEISKASKFDDVTNGIDMIATLLDKYNTARHFETASDLTIGQAGVASKLNRVIGDIYKGRLATVNYYHSDLIGYTGRIVDVPRTVISLDRNNLNRLLTNWIREPEMPQEQLARLMIHQINIQAEGFAAIAKNKHGSDSRIFRGYKNTHEVSQELLETGSYPDLPPDSATQSIENIIHRAARDSM